MTLDDRGRPVCLGWGPARRCRAPVHPGYWLCPNCLRPYTNAQMEAALALPENESFRRPARPAPTPSPGG